LNEVNNKEENNEKIKIYKTLSSSYLGLKIKEEDVTENSIWKKEEINNLQKAVKKFPAGTRNRWEKIGEMVKTKSTNQIIQMTHYLTTNPSIKIENDIDLNNLLNNKSTKKKKKFQKKQKQLK